MKILYVILAALIGLSIYLVYENQTLKQDKIDLEENHSIFVSSIKSNVEKYLGELEIKNRVLQRKDSVYKSAFDSLKVELLEIQRLNKSKKKEHEKALNILNDSDLDNKRSFITDQIRQFADSSRLNHLFGK